MVLETAAMTMVAKPLVENLTKKLIVPLIDKFVESCKDKYNEDLIPKAEHFEEYILRTYEKYSFINTLVFSNTQLKLKDIYVAQTLIKENQYNDKKEVTAKIDKLPIELIKKYKKILITDTAGMGKSTITRRMFIDIIDNSLADVGIPIYIELNRLRKNHDIITEIREGLNSLSKEFDKDLLLKLIQKGGFIFFLDGYDEISLADRIAVTQDIKSFISKAGTDNYYMLTSRPEDGLSTFGDFQAFKIEALTQDEAFELLRKYDMTSDKEMSNKIIKALKSGEYRSIDEYLKNPLLVSLLFSAYNHKHEIPIKKHLFYSNVYEAFFDAHDFSKGIEAHQKKSGLAIDDFSRILRYVGFVCLVGNKIQFNDTTIIAIIKDAKKRCVNLNFNESDFFNDMLTSVPLFCKDGYEFKWVHKSLMEYFAARFIAEDAKNDQDRILGTIYKSESVDKYINLLDLYYDIDYLGFAKNIELPLLQDYIKFYDDNIFESQNIRKEYIEERIGCLFAQKTCVKSKERNYNIKMAQEEFRKVLGNKNIVVVNFRYTYIGIHIQPQKEILRILFKKRKTDLFELVQRQGIEKVEGLFMTLKIIDVHTGEDDENLYDKISSLLRLNPWGHFCHLNYQKCCKEVEKIKNQIEKNDDLTSFLDSI